jgi:endogenous inhibitor of DNA gyrase (YacG/DUF329 family)
VKRRLAGTADRPIIPSASNHCPRVRDHLNVPASSPPDCPICGKPLADNASAESPLYPFCSVRCKQVDLARWWGGKYEVVEPLDPMRLLEADDDGEPFSPN